MERLNPEGKSPGRGAGGRGRTLDPRPEDLGYGKGRQQGKGLSRKAKAPFTGLGGLGADAGSQAGRPGQQEKEGPEYQPTEKEDGNDGRQLKVSADDN